MSSLYDFATHGDIRRLMDRRIINGRMDKLLVATQVAKGVTVLHGVGDNDVNGRSSAITHADIKPSQYVLVGYELKLNDFNLSELIQKNKKNGCCLSLLPEAQVKSELTH